MLNVLQVLVLIHGKRGDSATIMLNVGSGCAIRLRCRCVSAARITRPRLPVRSHEFNRSIAPLIDKALHERATPLLAAPLGQGILMQRLRIHLALSLFPAIFQIIRRCTL